MVSSCSICNTQGELLWDFRDKIPYTCSDCIVKQFKKAEVLDKLKKEIDKEIRSFETQQDDGSLTYDLNKAFIGAYRIILKTMEEIESQNEVLRDTTPSVGEGEK